MIDTAKRKRVMSRSMQLGHCICNPHKSCPCDVFCEHDICPCAGEQMEVPSGPVRLTSLVERPGCASKIDAAALRKIIAGLPAVDDPRVLIGMPAGDDAGVYQLDGGMTLVQTVDVFSPSVDDPYTFGQVAAANSLSDVYAMGARPITALSVVGFPIRSVADEVLESILRGGIDKMNEAGVAVIGGHSINDQEIKAGFAVTGLVDAKRVVSNAGLCPGDRLILTKPLGTGLLAFAAQIGRTSEEALAAAARSMAALNRTAAELMVEAKAHACTDVTGFGLMGHLGAMAAASHVDVTIIWDDLPVLPGVLQCLAEDIISGAVERNREASGECVRADDNITPAMLDLCFDAQTSGGLLIAVAAAQADAFLKQLHERGVTEAAQIGTVREQGSGQVFLQTTGTRRLPPKPKKTPAKSAAKSPTVRAEEEPLKPADNAADCCCAEQSCCDEMTSADQASETTSAPSNVEGKFQEFLKAAAAPGALDARTKKAIAIALSVLSKCEPCVKMHIRQAREMGFTQEEIDEAAWMAIGFGGSPLMLFYKTVRRTE